MYFTPLDKLTAYEIRAFQERYVKSESGCWNWDSKIDSNGYGRYKFAGVSAAAHRVSYTVSVGHISGGMVIDHLCRNRRCVNPEHLEMVTQQENIFRGESGAVLRSRHETNCCARGHEIVGENAMPQSRNATPKCRECNREYMRLYMRTYKAPKAA